MPFRFDNTGTLLAPTQSEYAEADASSAIIVLDQGTTADGAPYWLYLAVIPSQYEAFLAATKSGQPMNHKEYGTLIRFGFDADVPAAVKADMRERHGFDEHYLDRLLEKLKAAQKQALEASEARRIGDIVAMLKARQSH